MTRGRWYLGALILLAGFLKGCDTGPQTAGIDRSGAPVVVEGPITGFGSIIVNDVRYEVGNAQIQVNGAPATEADLALGQIVTLVGTLSGDGTTGSADSVVYEANVQGPVEVVNVMEGRLVVLGQTVAVDMATVFELGADPAELASIAVNDEVQVSGFVGAGGLLGAARIERKPAMSELRVIGTVANLDTAAMRFEVNDLVVDYSAAQMIEGFPTGEPANGDEVLVEGSMLGGGGELVAEELELLDEGFEASEGEEAEVEGLITRFVSPTDFDVAGVPVTTNATTVYEGGTEADLQLNVKIQVEGTVNASGVIVADKIEVKDGGRVVGS